MPKRPNVKKLKTSNIVRITTAAKEKGVSRMAVYSKIARKKLDTIDIDGQIFILKNHRYEKWIPVRKV